MWNPILRRVEKIKRKLPVEVAAKNNWKIWEEYLEEEDKEFFLPLACISRNEFLLVRYEDCWAEDFWTRHEAAYMEARSVTINLEKMELVTVPFKKFLNYGEGPNTPEFVAALLQSNIREVVEKLDGSMCVARYYNGKPFVHSAKSFDSWRVATMKQYIHNRPHLINKMAAFSNLTFIFEFIHPQDAHVVQYSPEEYGLHLIGLRDVYSGMEMPYVVVQQFAKECGIGAPAIYNKNLEEILHDLTQLKANEHEGYVVNVGGYKIKFKADDYVQIHRMIGKFSSPNLIIQQIADGTWDDFISKVPDEYKERAWKVARQVISWAADRETTIRKWWDIAPKMGKKKFMIWVGDNVPKELQPYVRMKCLGQNYNILKKGKNGYRKASEIVEMEE